MAWLLAVALLCLTGALARAQTADSADASSAPVLKLERADGALLLSAQLSFDLPAVVEDALLKGIPIHFVEEAEVLRERWYWTNRKITQVQRRMRLAYHPLTRRWRLTVTTGDATEATQGFALTQNFESLPEVMVAMRRISKWKIADASDITSGSRHLVTFRFMLDTAQLPRPLQIGNLGQSDWSIEVSTSQALWPELGK